MFASTSNYFQDAQPFGKGIGFFMLSPFPEESLKLPDPAHAQPFDCYACFKRLAAQRQSVLGDSLE